MSDSILLKIKRQFTSDEAVNYLQSELSKSNFKNGELLSEVSELKNKLHTQNFEIENLKKQLNKKKPVLTKEDLKDQRVVEYKKRLESNGVKIKRLNDELNLWRNKCLNMISRENNLKAN